MSQIPPTLKTTIESEHNPKAVFAGDAEAFVTPLAVYLSERSVDLYAGKTLDDALFGDYFFFTGVWKDVRDFVEKLSGKLPKTLLLLQDIDTKELPDLSRLPQQVKIVHLGGLDILSTQNVDTIIEFFFSSSKQKILHLFPTSISEKDLGFVEALSAIVAGAESKKTSPDFPAPKIKSHPTPRLVTETVTAVETPQEIQEDADENDVNTFTDIPAEKKNSKVLVQKKSLDSDFAPEHNETISQIAHLYNVTPKTTGSDNEELETPPKKRHWSLFISAFVMILVILISPAFILIVEVGVGGWSLQSAKHSLQSGSLTTAQKQLVSAETFLGLAKENFTNFFFPLLGMIGHQSLAQETVLLLDTGEQSAQGLKRLVLLKEDITTLIKATSGQEKGVVIEKLITNVKGELTLVEGELGSVQANLQSDRVKHFLSRSLFTRLSTQVESSLVLLKKLRSYTTTLRRSMSVLPQVLGFTGGKKTYLLLFQNNMELRPTGGFIGSYGLMTFDEGILKDFKVEDVYTADGALQGHVDPPAPIKVYLEQEHWYMRDSNWDPDFSVSAERAAWFLEKELDVKVDGVVAVDVTFIEYLLQVVGQLDIADYNEKISADNLYLKLQMQTQKDFFPGSTQKKDILGTVARNLILTLFKTDKFNIGQLLVKTHQALIEKHVLFFFPKTEIESLVQEFGWAGAVNPKTCKQPNCFTDQIMVVDANIGVNKANYFVRRNTEDQVSLSLTSQVDHSLTISYNNTSPKGGSIGGVYKDYLRIYAPNNANLTRVEVNSLPLTLDTGNLASASVAAEYKERDFSVFAVEFEVNPQEEKNITFHFNTQASDGFSSTNNDTRTYRYNLMKQPGVVDDGVSIIIQYPANWALLHPEGQGEAIGIHTLVKPGQITYNSGISQDQMFETKFKK